MRTTRRLDQLRQAQKEMVGLNRGGGHHRVIEKPSALPTLSQQGIDKNLAHQARTLCNLPDEKFEEAVADARAAGPRIAENVSNPAWFWNVKKSHRRASRPFCRRQLCNACFLWPLQWHLGLSAPQLGRQITRTTSHRRAPAYRSRARTSPRGPA